MGTVTLSRRLEELASGQYLLVEVLDSAALAGHQQHVPRRSPMPEALVVFDHHGAGVGQLIAFSEGGEATPPFRPKRVPVDAYCAAILDTLDLKM